MIFWNAILVLLTALAEKETQSWGEELGITLDHTHFPLNFKHANNTSVVSAIYKRNTLILLPKLSNCGYRLNLINYDLSTKVIQGYGIFIQSWSLFVLSF